VLGLITGISSCQDQTGPDSTFGRGESTGTVAKGKVAGTAETPVSLSFFPYDAS
jgi:hypothetical protein